MLFWCLPFCFLFFFFYFSYSLHFPYSLPCICSFATSCCSFTSIFFFPRQKDKTDSRIPLSWFSLGTKAESFGEIHRFSWTGPGSLLKVGRIWKVPELGGFLWQIFINKAWISSESGENLEGPRTQPIPWWFHDKLDKSSITDDPDLTFKGKKIKLLFRFWKRSVIRMGFFCCLFRVVFFIKF